MNSKCVLVQFKVRLSQIQLHRLKQRADGLPMQLGETLPERLHCWHGLGLHLGICVVACQGDEVHVPTGARNVP